MPTPQTTASTKRQHPLIALCGNPNSGKTTLFNALTGLNQRVANYPGVTVERTSGFLRGTNNSLTYEVLDIPGTYSLAPLSPDERIAIAALSGELEGGHPDAIICVLDASNLERSLFFLLQVQQIEAPVVVALNMMDIAERTGLSIDIDLLSKELGVPIIPVQGNRNKGIKELQDSVTQLLERRSAATVAMQDPAAEAIIQQIMALEPQTNRTRADYVRILFDVDSETERKYITRTGEAGEKLLNDARLTLTRKYGSLSAAETTPLIHRAEELFKCTVSRKQQNRKELSNKLDAVLLHPVAGPIILVLILGLIFQSIFSWAQPFMEWIDAFFGWLADTVGAAMPEGALCSLVTDGIIGGVGAVIIFIPQIAILFIFLSILEDSGYVTRAAFLVDRLFRFCGLSGKSLIPMLSSFACAIPGIMAARTIEDRGQRLITIMVAPLMTCSARLPVYAIMIAAFIPYESYGGVFNLQGLVLGALYLLGVLAAVIAAFVMNKLLFRTERGSFVIEMPTYKLPTVRSVTTRVINRTRAFVTRAGTIILAITIVIWAASYYPRSTEIQQQYDEAALQASTAFIAADTQLENSIQQTTTEKSETDAQLLNNARNLFTAQSSSEGLLVARDSIIALYPLLTSEINLLYEQRELGIAYTNQTDSLAHAAAGEQIRNSYFGRLGHTIEPLFEPLGWDWRITMAALASFPAREVIIAVLGTIYNLGSDVDESSESLMSKMQTATWDHGDRIGQPVFTPAVALSIMVFFALCCQCGATIVTIKQETARWSYAIGTFLYMTILAYLAALATYQFFSAIGW